ncbi:hypothetical protein EGR_10315 [Echinococcus granulosus]|uniref:Uncharacterized protein n=1 Tax=Echinococcus granulosus TaxID=6210 RepID=W6U143_ECHGR|nr:hypothetical protein EGR_10315 [Echinococcus granulosus]EUB54830.1 hypothetical protein EGR_10315 [Echinococcus granulosus]
MLTESTPSIDEMMTSLDGEAITLMLNKLANFRDVMKELKPPTKLHIVAKLCNKVQSATQSAGGRGNDGRGICNGYGSEWEGVASTANSSHFGVKHGSTCTLVNNPQHAQLESNSHAGGFSASSISIGARARSRGNPVSSQPTMPNMPNKAPKVKEPDANMPKPATEVADHPNIMETNSQVTSCALITNVNGKSNKFACLSTMQQTKNRSKFMIATAPQEIPPLVPELVIEVSEETRTAFATKQNKSVDVEIELVRWKSPLTNKMLCMPAPEYRNMLESVNLGVVDKKWEKVHLQLRLLSVFEVDRSEESGNCASIVTSMDQQTLEETNLLLHDAFKMLNNVIFEFIFHAAVNKAADQLNKICAKNKIQKNVSEVTPIAIATEAAIFPEEELELVRLKIPLIDNVLRMSSSKKLVKLRTFVPGISRILFNLDPPLLKTINSYIFNATKKLDEANAMLVERPLEIIQEYVKRGGVVNKSEKVRSTDATTGSLFTVEELRMFLKWTDPKKVAALLQLIPNYPEILFNTNRLTLREINSLLDVGIYLMKTLENKPLRSANYPNLCLHTYKLCRGKAPMVFPFIFLLPQYNRTRNDGCQVSLISFTPKEILALAYSNHCLPPKCRVSNLRYCLDFGDVIPT